MNEYMLIEREGSPHVGGDSRSGREGHSRSRAETCAHRSCLGQIHKRQGEMGKQAVQCSIRQYIPRAMLRGYSDISGVGQAITHNENDIVNFVWATGKVEDEKTGQIVDKPLPLKKIGAARKARGKKGK
jgi:hypothetical protein